MGETQSTENENSSHNHKKQDEENMTESQKAFSKSHTLDKKEDFPLINIKMGEDEVIK